MKNDIVKLLKKQKNLILTGAPGTGKTYGAMELAVQCIDGSDENTLHEDLIRKYYEYVAKGQITFVTFHQSLEYEDFIEGLKPELNKTKTELTYKTKDGIFKEFCLRKGKYTGVELGQPRVMIIDEINRGNLSKIFGELITLIENDKRWNEKTKKGVPQSRLTLPLSKEEFYVPDNVYIIGTMNSTDKSVGSIDYALRRRFVYHTVVSDKKVIEKFYQQKKNPQLGEKALQLYQEIREKIQSYKQSDIGDIEDLMVGHSYFLANTESDFEYKRDYAILPLLREYYNDDLTTQDLSYEVRSSNVWIIPWDPNAYDLDSALKAFNGEIYWTQNDYKFNIGDIVYVYVSHTLKSVKYKFEVLDVDVPKEKGNIDRQFRLKEQAKDDKGSFIKIKLVQEFNETSLDTIKLRLKAAPQGKMKATYYAAKVLESEFNKERGIQPKDKVEEMLEILRTDKNLILQGAPGTGKTYHTAFLAVGLIDKDIDLTDYKAVAERYEELFSNGQICFITFHQSLEYEDFVEGLKPIVAESGKITYDYLSGIFKQISLREKGTKYEKLAPKDARVLIIDEINRGNIGKIFGELISMIEKDKRKNLESDNGLEITLPSGDKFYVPDNLYIIGTMNTTDRSVGNLDYAIRRRFSFYTLTSEECSIIKFCEENNVKGKDRTLILNTYKSIREALDVYGQDVETIEDLMIGHSYFMATDKKDFDNKLNYAINPLLKEYFNDGLISMIPKFDSNGKLKK